MIQFDPGLVFPEQDGSSRSNGSKIFTFLRKTDESRKDVTSTIFRILHGFMELFLSSKEGSITSIYNRCKPNRSLECS